METIEDANVTVQVQSTTEGYISGNLEAELGIVFKISRLFKMTVCKSIPAFVTRLRNHYRKIQ